MKINGEELTNNKSLSFNLGIYGLPSDNDSVWNAACISENFKVSINKDGTFSYFNNEEAISEDKIKKELWSAFKAICITYLKKGSYENSKIR